MGLASAFEVWIGKPEGNGPLGKQGIISTWGLQILSKYG